MITDTGFTPDRTQNVDIRYDVPNAFDNCCRTHRWGSLSRHLPSLYRFVSLHSTQDVVMLWCRTKPGKERQSVVRVRTGSRLSRSAARHARRLRSRGREETARQGKRDLDRLRRRLSLTLRCSSV